MTGPGTRTPAPGGPGVAVGAAPGRPVRRRGRQLPALAGTAVAVTAAVGLSLLVGTQPITPVGVVAALADPTGGSAGSAVVLHLRVPRTAAGLLSGAGLGLAGAVVQGLTRNPLAGPGVLGVNAGAALAAVVAIALVGVGPLGGYVWFCFAGAALALAAVFAIATAGAGATPVRLAVAGAAVSALLFSLTSAIVLLDHDMFERYRFWLVGSLARPDLATVLQATPFLAAGAVLALALARPLDAVALGEDTARSVGARPGLLRGLGIAAVVVLAGTATAVAGPVGFVGLVVPHVARMLVGAAHVRVLPLSALLGALVLLLADVAGRVVLPPEEVQVGVTAAVLGAPVFLYLVRRRRVAQL